MPQTQGGGPDAAKAPRTKPGAANRLAQTARAALSNIADALCKAAIDSYRAHHRYAELVDHGAPDPEQRAARSAVKRSDEILDEAVGLYELACLEDSHGDEAWWHHANMVWRAAKEYLRHHASSNRLTRGGEDHSRVELMELGIEYELEASALLRLRHEVESYEASRLKSDQIGQTR